MKAKTKLKILNSSKQGTIRRFDKPPANHFGTDGDLGVAVVPRKGVHLFYKMGGIWYGVRLEKVFNTPLDDDRVVLSGLKAKDNGELSFNAAKVQIRVSDTDKELYRVGGTDVACTDGGTGLSTFGASNRILKTSGATTLAASDTLPNDVQDNITRVGTITNGAWDGDAISASKGGVAFTGSTDNGILTYGGSAGAVTVEGTMKHYQDGSGFNWLEFTSSGTQDDAVHMFATATAHDTAGDDITISAGNTTAGTTNNIVGGHLVLNGGQGKGSGIGGSITFQIAPAGSSGSSLNALVNPMTISGSNGDIILNYDTKIAAAKKLYLDGGTETYIDEESSDRFRVTVGGDEMLILDEATDTVSIGATNWVAGTVSGDTVTEFSSQNSAYAGMILGYTHVYDADANQFQGTTTSHVNLMKNFDSADHYLKVAFVVPPSNKVEIEVYLPYCTGLDNFVELGLATDISATTLDAKYEQRVWDVDETDQVQLRHSWYINGSDHSWAAGQSKTLWATIKHGDVGGRIYLGNDTITVGGWVMRAIALPATIGDGT